MSEGLALALFVGLIAFGFVVMLYLFVIGLVKGIVFLFGE